MDSQLSPATAFTARRGGVKARAQFLRLWRGAAFMPWLAPAIMALLIALAAARGAFAVPDGMLFDFATRHEAGTAPRVLIVERDRAFEQTGSRRHVVLIDAARALGVARIAFEADPGAIGPVKTDSKLTVIVGAGAQLVPGSSAWRLRASPASFAGVRRAALLVAPPEYGVHRGQFGWLPGVNSRLELFESVAAGRVGLPKSYLIRIPLAQNLPRITASQLIQREVPRSLLAGMIVLVEPASGARPLRLATPLSLDGQGTPHLVFSAHAVQTLATGREVVRISGWAAALIVALAALLLTRFYRQIDPKRVLVMVTAGGGALVLGSGWLALQFANVLLPVTGLLLALAMAGLLATLQAERGQDDRLQRFVGRAINIGLRRTLFRDPDRLPEFLLETARVIGIRQSLLFRVSASGAVSYVAGSGIALDAVDVSGANARAVLEVAQGSLRPHRAAALISGLEGTVRLAGLGGGRSPLYWLYTTDRKAAVRSLDRLVAAMIASYREMQQNRASLNRLAGFERRFQPIDRRVGSAVNLVSEQGEQLRHAHDALDTAIMLFHLIGYPLHANTQMIALYEEAGLPLTEATLPDALAKLTDLDAQRIDAMLGDLLLNGGEMRVPAREFGSTSRMLRVAMPSRLARGRARVVVLEAINITDVKRLAELRQAVTEFIDSQLRNDLEAITLGASMAADPRLDQPALARVAARILEVSRRATTRLDDITLQTRKSVDLARPASFPVDVRTIITDSLSAVRPLADDLGVLFELEMPEIGGFTIAEPRIFSETVEAMLRVIIADAPEGSTVQIVLHEEAKRTMLRLSGGFGIPFERLCAALDAKAGDAPPDFAVIARGIGQALHWNAAVSYWSDIGKGYRFNIEMRRIG